MATDPKIPAGYRPDRGGCWNCVHCFCESEHDEGDCYLCCHEGPPRPTCTSILLGEYKEKGLRVNSPEFNEATRAWREWTEGREVKPWAQCAEYERAKP